MRGTLKLDVAQGDDTDEHVREVLLPGVEDPTFVAEPSGKYPGGGHPEWKFEGDVRDLFVVLLNWQGIRKDDREELTFLAHSITIADERRHAATYGG